MGPPPMSISFRSNGPIDEPGWDNRDEVTIGILTALPVEGAAMASLLDGQRRFSAPGDPNNYRLGELPSNDPQLPHRVALVVLPRDGTRQAAAVCNDLIRTFPRVRCVTMVGVAGGIPRPLEPPRHVRLGDVVVATDGIVDYGHVRRILGGQRLRRLSEGLVSGWLLRRPPQRVAQPVADLRMHDQRTYLVRGRAVRALK